MKSLPLALLLTLAACVDDFPSLIILGNQAISEDTCTVDPSSNVWTGTGIMDVTPQNGFASGYVMTLVIQNGSSLEETAANQNIFFAEGADVELRAGTTTRSGELIADINTTTGAQRTQRFSSSIGPGDQGGAIFLGVDADQALAAYGAMDEGESIQIIVAVQVFGTIDTNEIESNWFTFPVTICRGCLFVDVGPCETYTGETHAGGVCGVLQDYPLMCCDNGGDWVCPAVAP